MIVYIFIFHSDISAFDGKRKGFFASFGIGAGVTYHESRSDSASGNRTRGNFSGNVIVGFAPSNRLLFYTSINIALLRPEEPIELLVMFFGIHSHAFLGIGSNFYFKNNSPSLFFEGGIGLSPCHVKYEKETRPKPPEGYITGIGLFASIGYEFAKDGSIKLQTLWLNTYDNKVPYENQFNVVTVMLILNMWKF